MGVGLLVGLQREHAGSKIAGVRTFPLIAILGTLSGMVGAELGGFHRDLARRVFRMAQRSSEARARRGRAGVLKQDDWIERYLPGH